MAEDNIATVRCVNGCEEEHLKQSRYWNGNTPVTQYKCVQCRWSALWRPQTGLRETFEGFASKGRTN